MDPFESQYEDTFEEVEAKDIKEEEKVEDPRIQKLYISSRPLIKQYEWKFKSTKNQHFKHPWNCTSFESVQTRKYIYIDYKRLWKTKLAILNESSVEYFKEPKTFYSKKDKLLWKRQYFWFSKEMEKKI